MLDIKMIYLVLVNIRIYVVTGRCNPMPKCINTTQYQQIVQF